MAHLIHSFLYVLCLLACGLSYQIIRMESSPQYVVSEVPHWDKASKSLYFINIADENSTINRYDYVEDRFYGARIDNTPNLLFIIPTDCGPNKFLVGVGNQAVIAVWDGRSPKACIERVVFTLDPGTQNVINDVKTDQCGRFYCGTKAVPECGQSSYSGKLGGFYRYTKNTGLKELLENVYISNGLTWVRPTNKFYYVDSCKYDVLEFGYDPKTGRICGGHKIFSIRENGKTPSYILDGMTNDVNGNLYLAGMFGSRIIQFNPKTRTVVREIFFDIPEITSLAWGGPNLDILYVTTANKDGKQPFGSGQIHKIVGLGTRGYAGVKARICHKNSKCSK